MTLILLAWRLGEICCLLSIHAARFGARLLKSRVLDNGVSRERLFGEFISELFESLGATFIKVGQILSSRPDLLPPDMMPPLMRLQDRVAPFNTRKIPKLIRKDTGRSIEEIFESFDMQPLSSASVAQVHRARLKGGSEVVVKLRRPGLVRKVRNDLLLLRSFARAIDLLPTMRYLPLVGLIDEFGRAIEQQLDFRLEAENNRRFQKNFAGARLIKFPALFDEFCSDSMLTMEFIDGLAKTDALDFTKTECRIAATAGLRALYKMIFTDGFIHGDLHPGNIFFRRGGEVVLLDLGLVARLDGDDLKYFVEFFYGMATNNGKECARVIYETATGISPLCDREQFEAAMVDMIGEHTSKPARDFEVTSFAFHLFNIQRRFGIRGSTNFTMAIVSLAVFEGIVKQLYPDLDFQAEARKFIINAWSRTFLRAPSAAPTTRAAK